MSHKLSSLAFYFVLLFFGHTAACGLLVPWSGIEPVSLEVEVGSPNDWTTRASLGSLAFNRYILNTYTGLSTILQENLFS